MIYDKGVIKPTFTIRNLSLIAKRKEEERLAVELAAKEAKKQEFLNKQNNK